MKLVLHLHVRFRGYHYIAQTTRSWIGREPVSEPVVKWAGLMPETPVNLVSLSVLRVEKPESPTKEWPYLCPNCGSQGFELGVGWAQCFCGASFTQAEANAAYVSSRGGS